jgi:hypothetical protein
MLSFITIMIAIAIDKLDALSDRIEKLEKKDEEK